VVFNLLKTYLSLFAERVLQLKMLPAAPPGSCGSASSECICTTAARSIAALAKPTLGEARFTTTKTWGSNQCLFNGYLYNAYLIGFIGILMRI
jgi:hypothetical protein